MITQHVGCPKFEFAAERDKLPLGQTGEDVHRCPPALARACPIRAAGSNHAGPKRSRALPSQRSCAFPLRRTLGISRTCSSQQDAIPSGCRGDQSRTGAKRLEALPAHRSIRRHRVPRGAAAENRKPRRRENCLFRSDSLAAFASSRGAGAGPPGCSRSAGAPAPALRHRRWHGELAPAQGDGWRGQLAAGVRQEGESQISLGFSPA